MIKDLELKDDGNFVYVDTDWNGFGEEMRCSASPVLFIIRRAWDGGVNFEDLADGYGEGMGTHGDWSGIRDSSQEAKGRMFERALNHFFA